MYCPTRPGLTTGLFLSVSSLFETLPPRAAASGVSDSAGSCLLSLKNFSTGEIKESSVPKIQDRTLATGLSLVMEALVKILFESSLRSAITLAARAELARSLY